MTEPRVAATKRALSILENHSSINWRFRCGMGTCGGPGAISHWDFMWLSIYGSINGDIGMDFLKVQLSRTSTSKGGCQRRPQE